MAILQPYLTFGLQIIIESSISLCDASLALLQCPFVYRLNAVEDLMANTGLVADAKDVLRVLPDLERLLKKYVEIKLG